LFRLLVLLSAWHQGLPPDQHLVVEVFGSLVCAGGLKTCIILRVFSKNACILRYKIELKVRVSEPAFMIQCWIAV